MAEKMLSEKLGEVEYDGLIAGVNPKKRVGPGVIAGPEAETTFVRGTVFAKSAKDGKLHILGTEASGGDTLTADCILIEDVTMKASMDETVAVYLAGCFNPDKLTVKDSYTMTEGRQRRTADAGHRSAACGRNVTGGRFNGNSD